MKGVKIKQLAFQLLAIAIIGISIPITMAKIGEYGFSAWVITVSIYCVAVMATFHVEKTLSIIAYLTNPKNKKGVSH